MRKAIFTSILAIGFTAALAIAAGTPVPYIFQGGDPASASQVNANFQELADRIEVISTGDVYDFHNYVTDSSIQSKEFNTVGKCGDKETRALSRVAVLGGTKVTLIRKNTNAGVVCSHVEIDYLNTATEFQLLEIRGYDPASATLQGGSTFDDPIAILTSTMKMNSSWAGASSTTAVPPAPAFTGGDVRMNTLVDIEDITVPYNGGTTYSACLKIHRVRAAGLTQIDWYCSGLGYTKSMLINSGGVFIARELSNVQY